MYTTTVVVQCNNLELVYSSNGGGATSTSNYHVVQRINSAYSKCVQTFVSCTSYNRTSRYE